MHIATKRLLITPPTLERSRIVKQIGWLNDHENVRYSEQRHKRHTVATQLEYLQMGEFIGEISFGNDLVGTISAKLDRPNSVADIGILIGKKFWGDGIGLEAWAAFCDHLLAHGTRKVEAGMMANNFGMIGVCRKYGMINEGRKYDHFLFGEELIDATYFGKGR